MFKEIDQTKIAEGLEEILKARINGLRYVIGRGAPIKKIISEISKLHRTYEDARHHLSEESQQIYLKQIGVLLKQYGQG